VIGTRVGPWVVVGRTWRPTKLAGQGLVTVSAPNGADRRVHRGEWSIPRKLRRLQWRHIGDPGSALGYLVDVYQGPDDAGSKLFLVRTPAGVVHRFEHRLARQEREAMNNSFAAVSPDGQWLVSGEWSTMRRLLVFPMPLLNPAAPPPGSDLPLAGTVELDHPVRNVQGGTFLDERTLLLSSDDDGTGLWPVSHPLLEVALARPLDGAPTTGHVACLGSLPRVSWCDRRVSLGPLGRRRLGWGRFEVEGLDYDPATGDLRVVVIPPQPPRVLLAAVYRLRREDGPRH
jgi:hypothetical protein